MGIRIITPLGKLCNVKKAVPIASRVVNFNGSERFLCEVCKEESDANGIALDIDDSDVFMQKKDLVICNLSRERVNDIFYHLLVESWYDFSVFDYQKAEFFDKLSFDAGALPFTSEITMIGAHFFCNGNESWGALGHDCVDLSAGDYSPFACEEDANGE